MPAGIYARQQLVAEQGIEMAGERWDAWPDVGSVATNAANVAVANRATVDALAEVAGGVSTNAGNIATNTQRIATLEETLDDLGVEPEEWKFTLADGSSVTKSVGVTSNSSATYYCRWSSADVNYAVTNWIPSNGWPSTHVYITLYPHSTNETLNIGIPGNWEPENNLKLSFDLTRSPMKSGVSPGAIHIGTNSISSFPSSSGRRLYEFVWIASLKAWFFSYSTLGYTTQTYTSSGLAKNNLLPNNVFLPEFSENSAQTLAMSPSLTSLSPGESLLQPRGGQMEVLENPEGLPEENEEEEPR